MSEEKIWYLLSLQLSGEATPEELATLNALLQDEPELSRRVAIIQQIWANKYPSFSGDSVSSFNKHLQRLSNHLAAPALQFETAAPGHLRPRKYRWLWIGSSVAAATVALLIILFQHDNVLQKPVSHTVSTKAGSKSTIQLPDGTQVWLNADSKISYKEDFLATREVQLSGEAYFDVAKYRSAPFTIHTSTIDIKVLGTAFNVRSYPSEKTTETSLIRGAVEITLHNNPGKKILLKPAEKLIVNNSTPVVSDTVVNTGDAGNAEPAPVLTLTRIRIDSGYNASTETMWVKNRLAFEGESLEMIAAKIEHWYDVKVVIKNEALQSVQLRGVFENKSLTEVMEALRLPGHFNYQVKDGIVTIW